MNDQKKLWNNSHTSGDISKYENRPTDFALEVLKVIPPSSKILELGCGIGNDSSEFAKKGHTTIATDFSEVAIKKNIERFKDQDNLSFEVLDINGPFRFDDNEFDVVYARLSLHYFTDQRTRVIFDEIKRILKPNGYLCFVCKTTDDPNYGKGIEIEKDMFSSNGHIRHFFSEPYTKSLLEGKFAIKSLETLTEKFDGVESNFIKVIASAIK